jgi:hypothetical protein
MRTLTAPIEIVNRANSIIRWQVLRFVDHDDVSPPWMEVVVAALSGGAKPYPSAGATWTLVAVDATPSLCLVVNATSASASDQITTQSRQLTNAYTTLSGAVGSGSKNARRLAVEAACLTTGLVDAAFSST